MSDEIKDMLKALLEGQQVTNARLESMESEIKEIKSTMATKEDVAEIPAIKQAVSEMQEELKTTTENVGYLMQDMYQIKHRKNG